MDELTATEAVDTFLEAIRDDAAEADTDPLTLAAILVVAVGQVVRALFGGAMAEVLYDAASEATSEIVDRYKGEKAIPTEAEDEAPGS